MKNIHILPTEIPGRFSLKSNGGYCLSNYSYPDSPNFKNQNIYITSDEKIKEGDWVIHTRLGSITKVVERVRFTYKKIILTTDQDLIKDGVQEIPDEFLEWFVENPNCEWVVVEKKMLCDYCGEENCDNLRCRGYIDSVWYEIIIPKEELNYNVKQVKKNNLKNTQFEYELQAMIYEILKENNNSSIELQSSKLVECVTDYFNHIECTFIIKNGDKTNVKKGKLV